MPAPDYAPAVWLGSPHSWPGRPGPITHLVLHGTGSPDGRGALGVKSVTNTFQDPNAVNPVSAHYLVTSLPDPRRPGMTIVQQYVHEGDQAWANGIPEPGADAQFLDGRNPNAYTIAIETDNDSANDLDLTPPMLVTLLALAEDILARHTSIPRDDMHVVGHYRISPQSRARCPGLNFPWWEVYAALHVQESAPGDTQGHWDVPVLDQGFGAGLNTLHCGDTAAAEVLQALGKRPAGLDDKTWIEQVFAWVHPGSPWSDIGILTTPQQIVSAVQGRFPDVRATLLTSEASLETALAQGAYVEGFVRQSTLDGSGADTFNHFDVAEGIEGGQVKVVDSDRAIDYGTNEYPLTVFRAGEEAAPALGYGVAFWKENIVDPDIAAARATLLEGNPNAVYDEAGALFAEYLIIHKNWIATGKRASMFPGYLLRNEWANGTDAYWALGNAVVLHWHGGLVSAAEAKERSSIFLRCGWGPSS